MNLLIGVLAVCGVRWKTAIRENGVPREITPHGNSCIGRARAVALEYAD
jgi:hypothetical protein